MSRHEWESTARPGLETEDTLQPVSSLGAPPLARDIDYKIQLVNSFPPPTAIWRYARLATLALRPSARLATVCIGNFDFGKVDRSVSSVHGAWPFRQSVVSAINFSLSDIVLRDLAKACRTTLKDRGVVHYISEDIRPFVQSGSIAVTIHGNPLATLETAEFYSFRSSYRLALELNLKLFQRVATAIVQSHYVLRGLRDFGYDGKIVVIPPAVDPSFETSIHRSDARRRLGLPAEKRLVLSISTAERRKNTSILPKVMNRLPSDFVLLRVGPPIPNAINLGTLPDELMPLAYRASDVLLFPTLEEGFGLPVIEAFASGIPVVSSDIPVMSEVAGNAAQLVDPVDSKALAAACSAAAEGGHDWVERGRLRVRDFSIGALGARLSLFYRDLRRAAG